MSVTRTPACALYRRLTLIRFAVSASTWWALRSRPPYTPRTPGIVSAGVREKLQETMSDEVGVLRSATGISAALEQLAVLAQDDGEVEVAAWEASNLVTISTALARAALLREETRGSHWREDFPERDDADFAGHFDVVLVDGAPQAQFRPSPATDGGGS